ncbi:hypothetical protein [Croceiramulus getboli]|nr:hypothetical protein P8624_08360 [Flavobacteriaceae bacterium YJPT1-3]
MFKLKLGYLISYDYQYVLHSLKLAYDNVDEIYLAIDKNFRTWTGTPFEINSIFFEEIKKLDFKNKVKIYRDDFYLPGLTPIECDTRERCLLNQRMGKGWKIQLDSDEYIPNFSILSKYLRKHWFFLVFPKLTPIVFQGRLINLLKKTENGFIYTDGNEVFPFITNQYEYKLARVNYSVRNFNCDIYAIHQSWARPLKELEFKVTNWGHALDYDVNLFLANWKQLNEENYKSNLLSHPNNGSAWANLKFIKSNSIDDLISKFENRKPQKPKSFPRKLIFLSLLNKLKLR